MAQSLDLQVSEDELATVILLRAFSIAAPVLGELIQAKMEAYFGDSWLQEAGKELSPRTRSLLLNRPEKLGQDIYLITEIVLRKLDVVFAASSVDIDSVGHTSVLLDCMAKEVDCVGQSRTALFHGVRLSLDEVDRCLRNIQRLWTRFSLASAQPLSTQRLSNQLKVGWTLGSRRFFLAL